MKDTKKTIKNQRIVSRFGHYIWWALFVRGAALVTFGLLAVFWPSITLLSLLYITAGFIIVSGGVTFIEGATASGNRGWFLRVAVGFIELVVGVAIARHPHESLGTFITLLGIYLLIRGVFVVAAALTSNVSADYRGLLGFEGLLSILAGIVVVMEPTNGGLAFVWVLGLYAIVGGFFSLAMAVRLRKLI